ncbi:MAG TPA: RNA methyltransferase [Alphaproteobacteria bacterium]|nr:RNA methyltransferase [Alphaproteobacteria bacterium]
MKASERLAPAIILVAPQLAENIGATARAMLNCGLTDLRLVRPRPAWPHPRAVAAAAGADAVLDKARMFATAKEAIADLHYVYATTARPREGVKTVVTARAAAGEVRERLGRHERSGYMFGPERTGLENDEVALADALLTVPLNPDFSSLNLAQAVLVAAYEWRMSGDETPGRALAKGKAEAAAKVEVLDFFARLEAELDDCGFLRNTEMRPTMVRNIRSIFYRAGLMSHEVRTLHGILTGLTQRPHAAPTPAPRPAARAGKRERARRGREA